MKCFAYLLFKAIKLKTEILCHYCLALDNSSSHYAINYHRIITLFTLHNIHTISTHRICTISAHYLHNIFTISAHYLRRICTISAQYLHNICTVSAQYLHTIYTQNLHNIYTLSAHYLHDIYSLPAVPPSLPRLVCSPCSAPRPPGRWEEDTAGPGRGDTSCFHIFCQPTLGCAKKSDNNYPIMVVAQTESQPCSILGQPFSKQVLSFLLKRFIFTAESPMGHKEPQPQQKIMLVLVSSTLC